MTTTQTTTVANVQKKVLNKRGIADALEWSKRPDSLYIGRAMRYVPGVDKASKWANPYSVERYGRAECLLLFENYAREKLWGALEELEGKELGCWCCPEACHGDVLVRLLAEKR